MGRFFMEHPYTEFRLQPLNGNTNLSFYSYWERQRVHDATVWGTLSLSNAVMREHALTQISVFFEPVPSKSVLAARLLKTSLRSKTLPPNFYQHTKNILSDAYGIGKYLVKKKIFQRFSGKDYLVRPSFEMGPDPNNRVTLSNEKDLMNQLRPCVHFRFSSDEKECYAKSLGILGRELGAEGFEKGAQLIETSPMFYSHHMGTTRMSDNPHQGVVDKNCRVHGISNLFIAGSSVFPTGSSAAPTLTIVALAIRLADYVKWMMRSRLTR